MSRRPWMPLYTEDFLTETSHLTNAEVGAYLRLILYYWEHGGLPQNEEVIRRISRMSKKGWKQSYSTLRLLFGQLWRHHKCELYISQAIERSRVSSAKAKLRHSRGTAVGVQLYKESKKEEEGPRPVDKSECIPTSELAAVLKMRKMQ
jgi:uncharacterized protein YdaU (DUF1376 family)